MLRLALLSCAVALAVPAATATRWVPLSRTADAITGPIALAPGAVTMAGRAFRTGAARRVRRYRSDPEAPPAEAQLRRVRPANPVLLNGNRLCPGPVRWIVTWRTPDGLGLSASTATSPPTGAYAADSCGAYFYVRPDKAG